MRRVTFPGGLLLVATLLLLVCASAWAENPLPGTVWGEGMYFEITDSDYLNVTLQSTAPVKLYMQSVTPTVRIVFEPIMEEPTVQVTLGGLQPNTTYYKYEDEYRNLEEVFTDTGGGYTYVQDTSTPHNVIIEAEPVTSEDEDATPMGTASGEGTHFEIANSEYLNFILDSTVPVIVSMESIAELITINFEPAGTAPSAQITLSGLPPSTTFHKYEDDLHNGVTLTTDAAGAYTYTQDLSSHHIVFIQEHPSTIFISDNQTGGDCTTIGSWDAAAKTCTLTMDVFDTIQIDSDGITLDGNGHLLKGSTTSGSGNGIYANGRSDLTVRNFFIESFAYAIRLNLGDRNTVANNTISDVRNGIVINGVRGRSILDNIVLNNSVQLYSGNYGRDAVNLTRCKDCVVSRNYLRGNKTYWQDHFFGQSDVGIVTKSSCADVLNNTIVDFGYGMIHESPNMCTHHNTDTGSYNAIYARNNEIINTVYGLRTHGNWGWSYFLESTISDSGTAYYSGYKDNFTVRNTNFLRNTTQVYNYPAYFDSGSVSRNYYDNYDTPEEGCYDTNNNGYCDAPFTFPGNPDNDRDNYPRTLPVDGAVPAPDLPPAANAGSDVSVLCPAAEGATITLDGTWSQSPDNDVMRYTWSGPFGTALGKRPVVTVPLGVHTITLTVSEWGGLSDTDTMVVTVYDQTPPSSFASFDGDTDADSLFVSDVVVTIASDDECSGVGEIHYTLDEVEQPVTYASSLSLTLGAGESHTVRFWAVDNEGNVADPPVEFLLSGGSVSYLGTIVRANVDSDEKEAAFLSASDRPAVSADGRYVAFESTADNLVLADTNGLSDIFVRDLASGITERVSVDSAGGQLLGPWNRLAQSFDPAISSDGRYVVFDSNLWTWGRGVLLHDRSTDVTEIVVTSGWNPAISGDGRHVAFECNSGICLYDRTTGVTELLNVDSSGNPVGGYYEYGNVSVSAEGRYAAFQSLAGNLVPGDTNGRWDVFVRDREAGITERVSVDSTGAQGNLNSGAPAISSDGRYVAFESDASNLVPGDLDSYIDVFVHDRQTGITEMVSADSNGVWGNGHSSRPSISADGRYVTFHSEASNLVSGDTNGTADIFVHDRMTGVTKRLSVNSMESEANAGSFNATISADGSYVAFSSDAHNLVPNDTNHARDIFVYDQSNTPPVADAGPDQTVECVAYEATSVTLDSSDSYDPDLDLLTHIWSPFQPPAEGVSPQVLLPLGSAIITLTVDDGNGASDTDTVDVTVADTTPPVTTVTSISGDEGDNGWYTSTVAVTLEATDGCTGVREVRYRVDTDGVTGQEVTVPGSTATVTVTEDGVHEVYYWSVDNQGNVEPMPAPQPVKKDASPPDSTPTAPPPPDDTGGHYTGCVNVTLQEVAGASGILKTQYSYNGTDWIDYTGQFQVCDDGSTQVYSRGISNAGVTEMPKPPLVIQIDTIPPATSISLEGTMGLEGWYVTDVVVTLEATDATSGVAEVHYTLDGVETVMADPVDGIVEFTVSADGPHSVTYWSRDVAGNGETAPAPETFKIDNTDPSITVLAVEPVSYALCNAPTPGYEVSDTPSGIDEASVVEEHTGANANGVGTITYAVTVSDKAGRTATESVTYSVIYVSEGGLDGFQTPVTLDRPFKQGSTVPVKFVITDGCGTYISNATVTLSLQQLSGSEPVGDPIDGTANQPDAGNVFRYDPLNNHYIYNLSTVQMGVGTWRLIATPDDGAPHTIDIGLK